MTTPTDTKPINTTTPSEVPGIGERLYPRQQLDDLREIGGQISDGFHSLVDPVIGLPNEIAQIKHEVEVLRGNQHSLTETLKTVMKVVEEMMAENKKLRAEVDELKATR